MKIGFELEAFITDSDDKPVLVPQGLPLDECGWLVEIRSEPHTDLLKAIYLLKAEQAEVERKVARIGHLKLHYVPLMEISRDLKVKAAKRNGKGILAFENVYGHETHKNSTKFQTASTHISFTNEQEFRYRDKDGVQQTHTTPGFVDHAKIIVGLDRAFAAELKASKRNPGFYERKYDGRIEYRSLPNNVDFDKVERVLRKLLE